MAAINWSIITVPAPEDYSDKYQTRNQEKFFYTLLQILQQMKSINFLIQDSTTISISSIDLSGLEQAVKDLAYNNISIEIGSFRMRNFGKIIEEE